MSLRQYPSHDKDFLVRTTLPTSELSVRAVAAAVAIARAHGVRCTTPAVLTDRSNVLVHLQPAPVVARVATTTALVRPNARVWLAREIAVAQFLVARGMGVVPPSSEVPPGPHEADGFAVSFWRFIFESVPLSGWCFGLLYGCWGILRIFARIAGESR